MKPTDFATHLENFLKKYLPGQRNFSQETIKSYRDAFVLLLVYFRDEKGLSPEKITIKKLDSETIQGFISWLASARNNSKSTQNQRLAAIRSFFRYLQREAPEIMFQAQTILGIDFKRAPKPVVAYLSEETLADILRKPNVSTPTGRRDLALLCLLYDTGARVSEITDLLVKDIRFEQPSVIKLTGKGSKTRFVSLMSQTAALIESYFAEQNLSRTKTPEHAAFFNRQYKHLTRAGIAYIIQKYAGEKNPDITAPKISPHVFRHTKAMHLLKADVNIFYIRDMFGHAHVSTTEVYAKTETDRKREVLEKLPNNVIPKDVPSWEKDKGMVDWLTDLCK